MPIRVVDVNYTLFWIGWFVTVFVWTRGLAESLIRRIPSLRLLEVAALAALVLSVVLRGNVPIAVVDLQDRIPGWHAALEERHQAAREAARDGSRLEVLEVPTKPQLLFVLDLKRRSSHWANLGFAKYFGLESVRVKPPSR
jgi:hypothetical protein